MAAAIADTAPSGLSQAQYLQQRGLRARAVPGDGNCLFEAIRVCENDAGLPSLPTAADYRAAVARFLRSAEAAGWEELTTALQHCDADLPKTLAGYATYIDVHAPPLAYGTGIDLMVLSRLRAVSISWVSPTLLLQNQDPIQLNFSNRDDAPRLVLLHNGYHNLRAHFNAAVKLSTPAGTDESIGDTNNDPPVLSREDKLLQFVLFAAAANLKKSSPPGSLRSESRGPTTMGAAASSSSAGPFSCSTVPPNWVPREGGFVWALIKPTQVGVDAAQIVAQCRITKDWGEATVWDRFTVKKVTPHGESIDVADQGQRVNAWDVAPPTPACPALRAERAAAGATTASCEPVTPGPSTVTYSEPAATGLAHGSGHLVRASASISALEVTHPAFSSTSAMAAASSSSALAPMYSTCACGNPNPHHSTYELLRGIKHRETLQTLCKQLGLKPESTMSPTKQHLKPMLAALCGHPMIPLSVLQSRAQLETWTRQFTRVTFAVDPPPQPVAAHGIVDQLAQLQISDDAVPATPPHVKQPSEVLELVGQREFNSAIRPRHNRVGSGGAPEFCVVFLVGTDSQSLSVQERLREFLWYASWRLQSGAQSQSERFILIRADRAGNADVFQRFLPHYQCPWPTAIFAVVHGTTAPPVFFPVTANSMNDYRKTVPEHARKYADLIKQTVQQHFIEATPPRMLHRSDDFYCSEGRPQRGLAIVIGCARLQWGEDDTDQAKIRAVYLRYYQEANRSLSPQEVQQRAEESINGLTVRASALAMQILFNRLGFTRVICLLDKSLETIQQHLNAECEGSAASEHDALALYFNGHGGVDAARGPSAMTSDSRSLYWREVQQQFYAQDAWRSKPKVLIVQSCRGLPDRMSRANQLGAASAKAQQAADAAAAGGAGHSDIERKPFTLDWLQLFAASHAQSSYDGAASNMESVEHDGVSSFTHQVVHHMSRATPQSNIIEVFTQIQLSCARHEYTKLLPTGEHETNITVPEITTSLQKQLKLFIEVGGAAAATSSAAGSKPDNGQMG